MRTLALGFTTLFVLCCLALGCGGKKTNPGAATPTGSSAMDDPIALLPSAERAPLTTIAPGSLALTAP